MKSKKLKLGKQALDESRHVSHDMRISALGAGITVGQLNAMIKTLNIPDGAKLKFSLGADGWGLLESVSFCRDRNEVSLW